MDVIYPGTEAKVCAFERRYQDGLPIFQADDPTFDDAPPGVIDIDGNASKVNAGYQTQHPIRLGQWVIWVLWAIARRFGVSMTGLVWVEGEDEKHLATHYTRERYDLFWHRMKPGPMEPDTELELTGDAVSRIYREFTPAVMMDRRGVLVERVRQLREVFVG